MAQRVAIGNARYRSRNKNSITVEIAGRPRGSLYGEAKTEVESESERAGLRFEVEEASFTPL